MSSGPAGGACSTGRRHAAAPLTADDASHSIAPGGIRLATLFGFGLLAAAAALGWFGRYGLIEPEALAAACTGAAVAPGVACAVRGLLVQLTFSGTFGVAAVAGAALAAVLPGRLGVAMALATLVPAGMGLFLFDADWSASGAVAALLCLALKGQPVPQGREARPGGEQREGGPAE